MIGFDPTKQVQQGWLVLSGAVVLCLVLAYAAVPEDVVVDPSAADSQGQLLSELIRTQRSENLMLTRNLEELKRGVGFTIKHEFEVPDEELAYARQKGLFFHDRRNELIQKLDNRAHEKGIQGWDKNIGFAEGVAAVPARQPPPNDDADNLLILLQVTKRVVSICLETPTPLIDILVVPHGQSKAKIADLVRTIAPPGRPPLFREYTVNLKLKGSLSDILWVVHRLSPGRDEANVDFPLVLKSFTLTSDNVDLSKPIPQLSITMTVAGLSFLDDKERGDKVSGESSGVRSAPGTTSDSETPKAAPATARSF